MQLVLYDEANKLPKLFPQWLLRRIKTNLVHNMNTAKINLWNDVLNEQYKEFKLYPLSLKADRIIRLGIDHVIISSTDDTVIYHIDSNVFVPGLDRVKVSEICKLINYGTLSQEGFPLFTQTFNEVENNFTYYISEYLV